MKSLNTLGNLRFTLAILCALAPLHAQTARFTGVQSLLQTGILSYGGVVVDAKGDVFISDDTNGRIVEETPSGVVDLALGGGTPQYLALDTAGNLYVATTAPAALKKFKVTNGIYAAPVTISTLFQTPWGVAVDGSGTIYVTDHTASSITRFVPSAGTYTRSPYVTFGLNQPAGIASDPAGNLYVADRGNNRIVRIVPFSSIYIQTTLVSGLNSPSDVALNPSGDFAFVDAAGLYIEHVTGQNYTQFLLASNLTNPLGVAFDSSGSLYVADSGAQYLVKQTPTANFGSILLGKSSAPQTLAFVFDSATTLGSPQTLTMGYRGLDFADTTEGSCTIGMAYAAGATCTVSITFKPTASGTRNGAVVISDTSGGLAGTGFVTGNGQGPQITFVPGMQKLVGSSLSLAFGIAVDGAGQVYVAESANNRVLKFTPSGSGYTASAVGTGLNRPSGVAIDGAGNVYIADTGNNRVVTAELSGGVYHQSDVAFFGISSPYAVAVDSAGSVYISDTGNARVLKETLFNGTYSESVVASGFNTFGVAVDGSGNVYIVDSTNSRLLKETLSNGSYSLSIVVAGLNDPFGVAVDGAGNAYVADAGNFRVLKETLLNGNYVSTTVLSGTLRPYGTALDAAGNLYVNSNDQAFVEEFGTRPLLNFPVTQTGTTSGPQFLTVTNIGNLAATFPPLPSDTNPTQPPDFKLAAGSGTTCSIVPAHGAAAALPAGTSCQFAYVFVAPGYAGTKQEIATLLDNNLNQLGVSQKITLSGTAEAGQTINFPALPSPVAFIIGEAFPLKATASSGLPVTYTVTSGPGVIVNNTTLYVTGTGTIQVTATQPGSATYLPAPSVTDTVIVASAPTGVSATNTPTGGSSTAQVTLLFLTAGKVASIQALTKGVAGLDFSAASGGTCAIGSSYAVDQTCTVSVVFSPKYSGLRTGAVVLNDAAGATLATAYIQGTGLGPQLSFSPPVRTGVPTISSFAYAVAVDGAGNTYVADSENSQVVKETLSAGVYKESSIGKGLRNPGGLAVDAAGNVYISDSGNGRILKETLSGGVYTQTPIAQGLIKPIGIAVDGSGNIYVAEYGAGRILKETLSAGQYTQKPIITGLSQALGVAVDGAGNLYVADGPSLLKETLYNGAYTARNIAATIVLSYSVAVDGNGSVYFVDLFASSVLKETPSGDSYVQSTIFSPPPDAQDPASPFGVTTDSLGDVYIADQAHTTVIVEKMAAPPPLLFPNTIPGKTSPPQAMTLNNIGNEALLLSVPVSGVNPVTSASFLLETNADTTCPITKAGSGVAGQLAAGAACNFSYVFAPASTGSLSATSVLTDNSLNLSNAKQTFTLTGIGVKAQTINFPQPAPLVYSAGKTVSLTAVASSGLTVTYSVASGPGTVSGSQLTVTGVGSISVTASQAGDGSYAAAPPVTDTVMVTFQAAAVGSTSSARAVTVQTTSAGQLYSVQVLTQGAEGLDFKQGSGGTCIPGAAYTLNATCTVNVVFSPKYTGARTGAVVLRDPTGVPLGTAYLQGTGLGSQLTFGPPQQTVLASGLGVSGQGIGGIAVDGAGNAYIAANNQVVKESPSGGVYIQTSVAVGISEAFGLAVDGAGNVYIAQWQKKGILKETLSGGTYTATSVGQQISSPIGVAVDEAGNLYVMDTYLGLFKETLSAGGYIETPIATSPLNNPAGVAVDSAGNVYIADRQNNRVLKETPSGGAYVESIVASISDLTSPMSIAIDAAGNLYITCNLGDNWSTSGIVKETVHGNTYTRSVFLSTTDHPEGVAVDGAGNVYLTDQTSQSAIMLGVSSPPTLTFPSTAVGSSSAAQSISVTNIGNQASTFSAPASGVNPSAVANFTLETNSDTTCPVVRAGGSHGSLAANASCLLSYRFAPAQAGIQTGSANLLDNSLDVTNAIQSIGLRSSSALAQSISFPQPPTPVSVGYVPLAATASSQLPVTYAVLSGPGKVALSALYIVAPGTVVVQATQAGNGTYAPAPPVTVSITLGSSAVTWH